MSAKNCEIEKRNEILCEKRKRNNSFEIEQTKFLISMQGLKKILRI